MRFIILLTTLLFSYGHSKCQTVQETSERPITIGISLDAGALLKSNAFYSSELFANSITYSTSTYLQAQTQVYFNFQNIELEIGGGKSSWNDNLEDHMELDISDQSFNIGLGYIFKANTFSFKPFIGYTALNTAVLALGVDENQSDAADYFNSTSVTNQLYLSNRQINLGASVFFKPTTNKEIADLNPLFSIGLTAQYKHDLVTPVWSSKTTGLFESPTKLFDVKSDDQLNSLYVGLVLRVDLIAIN